VTRAGRRWGHPWSPARAGGLLQQGRHPDPASALPHPDRSGPGAGSATIDQSTGTQCLVKADPGRPKASVTSQRPVRERSSMSRRSGLAPAIGSGLMASRSSEALGPLGAARGRWGPLGATGAARQPDAESRMAGTELLALGRGGTAPLERSDHDLVGPSRGREVRTAELSQTSRRWIACGAQGPSPQCGQAWLREAVGPSCGRLDKPGAGVRSRCRGGEGGLSGAFGAGASVVVSAARLLYRGSN
jgi:hypothetical protein